MRHFQFLSLALFLSLVSISCGKDDTSAPIITISSPIEGSTLEKGKSHPFEGTVTDDTELASITAGGLTITTFDTKTSHTFKNISFPIDTSETNTNGSLEVTATDKAGNVGKKTVTFKIK